MALVYLMYKWTTGQTVTLDMHVIHIIQSMNFSLCEDAGEMLACYR